MTEKTYTAKIVADGQACYIPVPFDPRPVFGKVRAPVKVTVNGYSFRSTIASMGGIVCIPLRKSNRDAAGVEGGDTVAVKIELDADERRVEPPADLIAALKDSPDGWSRWQGLSYTHQRELVEAIESAKKPETRERRIAGALEKIGVVRR
jgi:hypothetical protein